MADNTVLDAGAGGDTIATDDVAGVKYQRVKLVDGTADSSTGIPGDATNGLDVDVTRVQGTVTTSGTVTNAGTFAVQDSEKVADNAGFTDGTTKVLPVGYVFDEVAGTALTENDAAAARIDSKRAQVGVIEDATTRGQRATVTASNALKVDGSAVTQPVSGTVTANAGTGTFTVDTELPAAASLADNMANPTVPQVGGHMMVYDGATWDRWDRSVTDGGSTLSVDDGAGSLTVDVGTALPAGTATIGDVGVAPRTSGGLSTFHLVSAATTNATSVKASAGQLYGWYIYNDATTNRKVAFHNTAGTPTAGASIFMTLNIPAGSAANVFSPIGIAFSTGIGITTVTGEADSDATAVTANDLNINLFYA